MRFFLAISFIARALTNNASDGLVREVSLKYQVWRENFGAEYGVFWGGRRA
jgi:hypothetical protein